LIPLCSHIEIMEVLGIHVQHFFIAFRGLDSKVSFFLSFFRFRVTPGAQWLPKWTHLDHFGTSNEGELANTSRFGFPGGSGTPQGPLLEPQGPLFGVSLEQFGSILEAFRQCSGNIMGPVRSIFCLPSVLPPLPPWLVLRTLCGNSASVGACVCVCVCNLPH